MGKEGKAVAESFKLELLLLQFLLIREFQTEMATVQPIPEKINNLISCFSSPFILFNSDWDTSAKRNYLLKAAEVRRRRAECKNTLRFSTANCSRGWSSYLRRTNLFLPEFFQGRNQHIVGVLNLEGDKRGGRRRNTDETDEEARHGGFWHTCLIIRERRSNEP